MTTTIRTDKSLEAAFPGASNAFREGRIERELALEVMREATLANYPECVCAFAHGSAISGGYREYSDLDVIVFLRDGNRWGQKCIMHRGFLVEFTFYTLDSLPMVLFLATSLRKPLALCAANSEIILDRDGEAEGLKTRLAAMSQAGPSDAAAPVVERLRLELTTLAVDLSRNGPMPAKIAVALDAYSNLVRASNIARDAWDYSARYLAKSEKLDERDVIGEFQRCYASLLQGDADPLRELVWSLIDDLGGALKHGFEASYLITPETLEAAKAILAIETE